MFNFRFVGLFTIIPTTLLLTVSFFVLFALRKMETNGLKTFGYVVVVLLWISSVLVFSAGIYTISTGRHPLMSMMHRMKGQMPCMTEPGEEMQGMMHKQEEKQEMMQKREQTQGMMQQRGTMKGQAK